MTYPLFSMRLPVWPRYLLATIFLMLAGCATAPTQEMSDARQSLQAAEDAGALKYDIGNMKNAIEYLNKAERELELRYFGRARHDAIVAKSEALKARNVSLALREAADAIDQSANHPDLGEAQEMFQRAVDAAREGKVSRALRLSQQIRSRLGQDAGVD